MFPKAYSDPAALRAFLPLLKEARAIAAPSDFLASEIPRAPDCISLTIGGQDTRNLKTNQFF
jgi:hypothetical protein